jgi:hypothetical protein
MKSFYIPEQQCAHCGYKMDKTTCAYGDYKPKPGDASICAACGALQMIEPDLTLREPTPEERMMLEHDQRIINAQIARAHLIGDPFKQRKRK